MRIFGVSRRLSVTTGGSSTEASLGAESGLLVEVAQTGASPVAIQPAGRAGATTLSKFWVNSGSPQGPGVIVGPGVEVGAGVGVAVGGPAVGVGGPGVGLGVGGPGVG